MTTDAGQQDSRAGRTAARGPKWSVSGPRPPVGQRNHTEPLLDCSKTVRFNAVMRVAPTINFLGYLKRFQFWDVSDKRCGAVLSGHESFP